MNNAQSAAKGLAKMLATVGENPELGFDYVAALIVWEEATAEFEKAADQRDAARVMELASKVEEARLYAQGLHGQIYPKIQVFVNAMTANWGQVQ